MTGDYSLSCTKADYPNILKKVTTAQIRRGRFDQDSRCYSQKQNNENPEDCSPEIAREQVAQPSVLITGTREVENIAEEKHFTIRKQRQNRQRTTTELTTKPILTYPQGVVLCPCQSGMTTGGFLPPGIELSPTPAAVASTPIFPKEPSAPCAMLKDDTTQQGKTEAAERKMKKEIKGRVQTTVQHMHVYCVCTWRIHVVVKSPENTEKEAWACRKAARKFSTGRRPLLNNS